MVGNPYRYRAALRQLDNRHATAGCLLVVLFLIPFAARIYNISMPILLLAASLYSVVVVPLATGYITLGSLFRIARIIVLKYLNVASICYGMHQIVLFLVWLHELYCSLYSIHTTVIQVLFFYLSEKALCPDQKFLSLYGLLFCTMLAYLYQSLHTRHWTQIMFTDTTADFFRLTTTFIILRLGKGVALSFVLITITLQFDHLEPTVPFVFTTGLYFIITQFMRIPSKENIIVAAVQRLDLYVLEGLEEYWVPIFTNLVGIILTICNVVIALNHDPGNFVLCVVVVYTNIMVTIQQLQEDCVDPFREQLKIMQQFPFATKEQMLKRGDTVCPVCLDDMRLLTARITPCQHIFHGSCLRKCMEHYQQCPMCKQPL